VIVAALETAEIPSIVLALSGIVVLLAIVRRSRAGRPLLRTVEEPFRPAEPAMLLLLAGGLFLVYQASGQLVKAQGPVRQAAGILIPLLASVCVAFLARRAVLLPRGSVAWRIGLGLLHVWAALPLVYGTFVLGQRLLHLPEQPAVLVLKDKGEGWQALALTAVLVAPVAEEICFRALLYPALRQRFPARWGILGSSLAFALVHPPTVWLPMAIFGAVLAWVVETTGSVLPCIAAHMAFNGLTVFAVLLSG